MKEIEIPSHAGIQAPHITHAFAIDKGYYGCIWKIYIEAEAPNGKMDKIAVVVHQTGYGYYPTDWIILNPDFENILQDTFNGIPSAQKPRICQSGHKLL